MLTDSQLGTLYETLVGFKNWSSSRRVLRYDGEQFYWWPTGRSLPADQAVGVYDPSIPFSQFAADVRWAEQNMQPAPKPYRSAIKKGKAWKAA
jgi:hypothetical protein